MKKEVRSFGVRQSISNYQYYGKLLFTSINHSILCNNTVYQVRGNLCTYVHKMESLKKGVCHHRDNYSSVAIDKLLLLPH